MIIREENPADLKAIRQVVEAAFGRKSEADLVDALRRNGKRLLSLVAEQDGQIVGHIFFSPVSIESEAGSRSAVGLAPLAVLPEFQNCGVGSKLVRAGLDQCRNAGHDCVVVLGHPEYYPRFGFAPSSRFGVKSEYDVRDEAFMLIELKDGALGDLGGTVKYQPEFNEV